MKKWLMICLLGLISCFIFIDTTTAQCSICTRTAQQMGEKPAKAINAGIIYLAAAPFIIVGIIGYRWWKSNREQ